MICFIDMDGVIADFVAGICLAHGRTSPYAGGANLGVFDMEKIWGITPEEFWRPANSREFWEDLPKTPEADSIIALASARFAPEDIAILTSPSMDPGSIPGKRAWIERHYPQLKSSMILTSAKQFLAGEGRVLIDDRTENIDSFNAFGGEGVMVPRAWNRMHGLAGSVVEEVAAALDAL